MKFVPSSRIYRCETCASYCYDLGLFKVHRRIRLGNFLEENLQSEDQGQRKYSRSPLPMKLKILKVLRDGKEVDELSESSIYSMDFSNSGIAIRTSSFLQVVTSSPVKPCTIISRSPLLSVVLLQVLNSTAVSSLDVN